MNSIHHLNSLFVVCESHRGLSIYYVTWNQRNIPYLLERKIVYMKKAWKIDENDIKVWKFLTKFYLSDVTHKRPFWRFLSHQSAETKCNGTLTHSRGLEISISYQWCIHRRQIHLTSALNLRPVAIFFTSLAIADVTILSFYRIYEKKNYNFISPDILI